MWQTIDITNYIDPYLVDTQSIKFNLSAWIGGYSNQDDCATVSLYFADQFNQTIGSGVTIGPVFAVDRGSQSSLLFRQTQGFVPATTRFLTVIVTMTLYVGGNDGSADNIALILYQ